MMLQTGISELRSIDDLNYVRCVMNTLPLNKEIEPHWFVLFLHDTRPRACLSLLRLFYVFFICTYITEVQHHKQWVYWYSHSQSLTLHSITRLILYTTLIHTYIHMYIYIYFPIHLGAWSMALTLYMAAFWVIILYILPLFLSRQGCLGVGGIREGGEGALHPQAAGGQTQRLVHQSQLVRPRPRQGQQSLATQQTNSDVMSLLINSVCLFHLYIHFVSKKILLIPIKIRLWSLYVMTKNLCGPWAVSHQTGSEALLLVLQGKNTDT